MKSRKLLFIVGPTASGKTELALREAERHGAAVLSCDSLCVYREMDIGTAKPTPAEQARAPHYGLDLCDPEETYSVGQYIDYRDGVLSELARKERPVLVVGGSGFYLKSFFTPVTDQVEIPEDIRQQVAQVAETGGLEGLMDELKRHNAGESDFPGLDLHNPRRVEQALARCLATGESYRGLREAFAALPLPLPDWDKEVWLVDRSPDDLRVRNRSRVESMLEAGLPEEVRSLRARGFERNPSACGAIGYREVLDCLDGKLEWPRLPEAIWVHTNQLMRKQRTWFRHQIPVHRRLRL